MTPEPVLIPPMRSQEEIQRAHDLLTGLLIGEIPSPFLDDDNRLAIHCAADVLCWVLSHDHNQKFAENLAQVEEYVKAAGFELTRAEEPFRGRRNARFKR